MKIRKRILSIILGLLLVPGFVTPALNVHANETVDPYTEPEANRVAYYSFDDVLTPTLVEDEIEGSDGFRNGTLANSATIVAGKEGYGNALYVEEAGQGMTVNANAGDNTYTGTWTVTYWVNVANKNVAPLNISQTADYGTNSGVGATLRRETGSKDEIGFLGASSNRVSNRPSNNITVSANQWQHWAFVKESNRAVIYIDGTEAFVFNNSFGQAKAPYDIIGGQNFTGYIDEVRIYDTALTQDALPTIMSGNYDQNDGCVSYYSFDKTEIKDGWGSHNGTLADSATIVAGKEGYGNALYVEEAGQGMTVNANAGDNTYTGTWTVTYWVNVANKNVAPLNISQTADYGTNSGVGATLRRETGSKDEIGFLGASSNRVSNRPSNNITVSANQWQHWAFVKESNRAVIYIDGTEAFVFSGSFGQAKAPYDIIGGQNFTGYIDEVKVYDTALTDKQVKGIVGIADYTALDMAIAEAAAMNPENYVDFTAVDTALNAARALSRDLVVVQQTQVDAAAQALADAIDALQKRDAGLRFSAVSISLHDSITVNYKVNSSAIESYEEVWAEFEFHENEEPIEVKASLVQDDGKHVFKFEDLAPQCMNDTIKVILCAKDSNGEVFRGDVLEYSVCTYCYNILNSEHGQKPEIRTLVVDLLNYGSAAQIYAGYQTDTLVNENLGEMQQYATPDSKLDEIQLVEGTTAEIENPSVTFLGAGLVLQNSVTVYYEIKVDNPEGLRMKLEVGDNTWYINALEFVEIAEGKYKVYFDKLHAAQMGEIIKATVLNNDTPVSDTVTYSINSYIYRKKDDPSLGNLVTKMFKYGYSASEYVK